jgi:CHASE3 domain sensor protein
LNALIRKLTARRLVVIGILVPLICAILIGFLQWRSVDDLKHVRLKGLQIRTSQLTLGVFRYSLSDAESCQFRYILTHTPSDLDLYRKLIAQADDQFAQLRQLTADNPTQQKFLDQVEPLLKAKEATTEQSLIMEQTGNHAGALQIISSDASRQNMLDIERNLEDMQAVAGQLLFYQQNAFSRNIKITSAVSIAGLLVNLGCIAAILLLIRRLQAVQTDVTLDALKEMLKYEDGTLTIEEYLRRRAEALAAHGQAQIEAEKLLSQLERRKVRNATQRVRTTPL